MNDSKFLKNIITIMLSNALLLVSQVLVGLMLPKILNVSGFGNYRIFMLYGTYASLLHFGFVDGILVKFGGNSLSNIDTGKISGLFTFFMCLEFIVSIIIEMIAFIFFENKYRVIFGTVGLYSFFLNIGTAFQFLSQATMNFKIVARISNIQALLNTFNIIIPSIFIYVLHVFKSFNYVIYIFLYINAYMVLLFIYLYVYNKKYNLVRLNFNFNKELVIDIFKIGFPITIASQIGNITLNLDNQFVSLFFKTTTFARYSFSYNLISLTISIVLAISTVLFPYLNKEKKSDLIQNYSKSMSFMLIFIYLTLLSYYPIRLIIEYVLPQYVYSLTYFRILLPGVAITTSISTIIFNHYKATGDMKLYLQNGFISLILSLILYMVSYYLFKDVIVLAFASLIALFIWFFMEDYSFRKKYKIVRFRDYFYIILCTFTFQFVSDFRNMFLSILSYIVLYLVLTYLLEGKYLKLLCKNFIVIPSSK